ncbi:HD-GYP domain-containing protein [Nitrosomonas sp.]|uniref:HD-GYP domain-containing protein n=1 Tax=Nitrosomonas sp. TaxID=42353 RepID=UPI001E113922|nr:HD domain-containing phosphohydrolase [Nitrosomonas sp.]MBX3618057.1 HD domain-containing protein [Nitrosomonas sp.]
MFHHHDLLNDLDKPLPIQDKIISAHRSIQQRFPFISRIAVALYDPETRILKTYLHSSGDCKPLANYQTTLDDAPSLKEILAKGLPRVVNNLVTFEDGKHEHTRRIGRHGYAASYTMPIFHAGEFVGFLFFNSHESNVFAENVLSILDIYGHLIALMVINELTTLRVMGAALKTTSGITHVRDPETGSHLDRMSRYSRLIAEVLAEKYNLDDAYIEHIFMFSPLHDIGKISIPDSILLKPGRLDDQERTIMNTHAQKGRDMIDDIVMNFGFNSIDHINILRNIAEFHHEAVNGSGYPSGKKGQEIPLEARIVAVADVFDALTSQRPYKEAWSNQKAFDMLKQMAGTQLDSDCVNALINNEKAIESIQQQFKENIYG